jgi:hypothetical protein
MTTKKHRVSLSFDKKVWIEFKENLKSYGFPSGTASYLIQQYMERINIECESNDDGMSPQLEMFDFDQMAEIRGEKRRGKR